MIYLYVNTRLDAFLLQFENDKDLLSYIERNEYPASVLTIIRGREVKLIPKITITEWEIEE